MKHKRLYLSTMLLFIDIDIDIEVDRKSGSWGATWNYSKIYLCKLYESFFIKTKVIRTATLRNEWKVRTS